jgi:cation transport ATPase
LAQLRREVGRSRGRNAKPGDKRRSRRRHGRHVALSALIAIAKLSAIIALPFVVYVRASVFFYDHGAHVWVAIVAAAGLTMALVLIYAAGLARQLRGRARMRSLLRWIALPIVAAWCLFSLFFLARVNAKSDEVRGYFLSVHPILRVALSTVILVDPGLVITDMARKPSDYGRMGLPMNDKSKHYEQPDGWVHAVDLRTKSNGEIRNWAVQLYFEVMGFSTLRHVGTADHLHVQMRRLN